MRDAYSLSRPPAKGVEGRTKTRKKRRVYLCATVMQALREQLLARRPTPTGLVYPSPRSDGVWNSDNFRADVFAKRSNEQVRRLTPAGGKTSSGSSSTTFATGSPRS